MRHEREKGEGRREKPAEASFPARQVVTRPGGVHPAPGNRVAGGFSLLPSPSSLHKDERGQMAIAMVLSLLVVFLFFALAFDAGLWFFDHRTAQNQAEAAALAGVIELPDTDPTNAIIRAEEWLSHNGADPVSDCELPADNPLAAANLEMDLIDGMVLWHDDGGNYKAIRVCVGRDSPGVFSSLSGIDFVHISGSATARTGPISSTNVMPWAVVAPDPTCTEDANRNCLYDANGDGDYSDDGDCDGPFTECPFGLTDDRLYTFKAGTGGNTGILRVCGSGANDYRECLAGSISSGFYEEGDEILVDTQGGTIANATDVGLQNRDPAAAWDLPTGAVCDVDATPLAVTTESPGWDPDGKVEATAKFVNPQDNPECAYRLVPIPIIDYLQPQGGSSPVTLGFASFGVAKWNSTSSQDKYFGTGTIGCRDVGNGQPPTDEFGCGVVWGYLFTGVTPPDALLQQISNTNNPFAPLLIALID